MQGHITLWYEDKTGAQVSSALLNSVGLALAPRVRTMKGPGSQYIRCVFAEVPMGMTCLKVASALSRVEEHKVTHDR